MQMNDVWLPRVRRELSPNCDARPAPSEGGEIELVVLHNISLPPGRFGTGMVPAFFCNQLDCSRDATLADLSDMRVSAHLFIDRRGVTTQFVALNQRAWHAGVSSWRGRKSCNDFAIGIELEGADDCPYTKAQYARLVTVLDWLLSRYPALSDDRIVGHSEIAPGRKSDPGPAFDWARLLQALRVL